MLFTLLQSELEGAVSAEAAQVIPQEQSFSLIQMASKGGWLMIVLVLLSIAAIYIFGKKWWMISRANKIDKNFMRDIRDYIHEGKIKSAAMLCQRYDSPIARLVEKGIETSRLQWRTPATLRWPALKGDFLFLPPSREARQ